jgi:hypothetical protein
VYILRALYFHRGENDWIAVGETLYCPDIVARVMVGYGKDVNTSFTRALHNFPHAHLHSAAWRKGRVNVKVHPEILQFASQPLPPSTSNYNRFLQICAMRDMIFTSLSSDDRLRDDIIQTVK